MKLNICNCSLNFIQQQATMLFLNVKSSDTSANCQFSSFVFCRIPKKKKFFGVCCAWVLENFPPNFTFFVYLLNKHMHPDQISQGMVTVDSSQTQKAQRMVVHIYLFVQWNIHLQQANESNCDVTLVMSIRWITMSQHFDYLDLNSLNHLKVLI